MNNTTAIITSFLRTKYTVDCVKSLRETYPDIKIIVGDNWGKDKELEKKVKKHGAKYIAYPFDCGVPYIRNRLIKEVKTRYVLVGDNDFTYDKEANLDKMAKFLASNRKYSMIGGRVRTNNGLNNYQGYVTFGDTIHFKNIKAESLTYDYCEKSGLNYTKVDMMTNFWIGRVKDLPEWDESQKIYREHTDYMLSIVREGKIQMAFTPEAIVKHKIQEYKYPKYKKYRIREDDSEFMLSKYNIIGFSGGMGNIGISKLRGKFKVIDKRIKIKAVGDEKRKRHYPGEIITLNQKVSQKRLKRLKKV